MAESIKILLVEDSETDADLLVRYLRREGILFECRRVSTREEFTAAMVTYVPDLVISDYSIPRFTGMDAFRLLRSISRSTPFILLTGTLSEKVLIDFAKEGIDDYILKDNLLRLPISIENVINRKTIEKLHRRLENVHKEVTDSINYAQVIQRAMLPDRSQLQAAFPNSFILFRPKDVLSGDFYWFKRVKNRIIIMVADCTGHGIPGSMLSMLGFNMLYEAVITRRLEEPAKILENLCRQFERMRRYAASSINDGMDVACCTVDLENRVMTYAGANRPVVIIRNNELMEIKPDKRSISGVELPARNKFNTHSLPILENDRVFMFSDGYADQFHYATKKKMLIKRFRELLVSSSSLPFSEQEKAITHYFENWKGDMEQVDDVLVLGFQV